MAEVQAMGAREEASDAMAGDVSGLQLPESSPGWPFPWECRCPEALVNWNTLGTVSASRTGTLRAQWYQPSGPSPWIAPGLITNSSW